MLRLSEIRRARPAPLGPRAIETSMLDEGHRVTDPEWQRELYGEITAANDWHRARSLATAG